MENNSISIIGRGYYGDFLFQLLDSKNNIIRSYDKGKDKNIPSNFFNSEIYFLAVSLKDLESAIIENKILFPKNSIIIETCSVNNFPKQILTKHLSHLNLISSHTLFGPKSLKNTDQVKEIVLENINSSKVKYDKVQKLFTALNLNIIEKTASEHDKEMATTHLYTQLIALLLQNLNFNKKSLYTQSSKELLNFTETLKPEIDLLKEILTYNKFSTESLEIFLLELNTTLKKIGYEKN